MKPIEHIKSLERIKAVADPRRLAILRRLMDEPATLTHLGRALGEHPAWIRHHLKLLESAGLVEMTGSQRIGGYVEKYYRASARAYLLQEMLLPNAVESDTIVLAGSHDLALEMLARSVHPNLFILPIGSLDGLLTLRQGMCQISACHLFDAPSGEYNLPYVRHFFPDQAMAVLTLAHREQGLLVAAGNPRRIRGLEDLAREDIIFVNRNRGSGTRLWLDEQLHRLGLSPAGVRGYAHEVRTHTEVAQAILDDHADLGLGIHAAARAFGLDFIPLFHERYDIVAPQEILADHGAAPLFDFLHSGEFRRQAEALGGYDMSHTGEQLAPVSR